jgi:hypothetical protein
MENPSMKKFTLKAITLATASVCGSAAFAGAITVPASDAAATPYAVESMTNTTAISVNPVTYTMGVSRTTAQDFTLIYKPSAGATFGTCPLAPGAFVTAGAGATTVSNKRSSATECAYEVDVTTALTTASTIQITGLTLATHTLATSGNTASVVLGVWELAENARIDNTTDLTRRVAVSGNALRLTAAADTDTTTDVNHPDGPLFGFVADGDDSQSTARANFVINNNTGATQFFKPDGSTLWDFTSDGTEIDVTVAGNFQGLATGGFDITGSLGTPTVTVAGGNATFSFVPGDFSGIGNYTVSASFLSAETASLGTSRTFGVSGVADVQVGANTTLAGNPAWWVWDANASQLVSTFFNTNPNYITRFFFLNTGDTDVGYSVECYTEGGNAVTNGVGGTLAAAATTNLTASSICTFPAGTPRGAVVFTINTRIGDIKGTYQQIAPTGADGVVQPLVRPYNNANTTE